MILPPHPPQTRYPEGRPSPAPGGLPTASQTGGAAQGRGGQVQVQRGASTGTQSYKYRQVTNNSATVNDPLN